MTVLFGLWRSDIDAAASLTVPAHMQDAVKERRIVGDAIRLRVWPLLVATSVVVAAFLPVLMSEVVKSVQNVAEEGVSAWQDYDPAAVAMAGVVALLVTLEVTLVQRLAQLRENMSKLRPSKTD